MAEVGANQGKISQYQRLAVEKYEGGFLPPLFVLTCHCYDDIVIIHRKLILKGLVMKKKFYKKVEVWTGHSGIAISDYSEKEGEPVFGIIISEYCPETEPDFKISLEDENFIYISEEKIDDFIEALKEFSPSKNKG